MHISVSFLSLNVDFRNGRTVGRLYHGVHLFTTSSILLKRHMCRSYAMHLLIIFKRFIETIDCSVSYFVKSYKKIKCVYFIIYTPFKHDTAGIGQAERRTRSTEK